MSEPISCHTPTAPPTTDNPFLNGLWKQNPVFVQVLGMCPTLAITNSVRNAVAMGLATTFVLVFSNTLISAVRKLIPNQVRIASYIAIIATSVTIVDYLVKAISIPVYKALGPFIPLIVANCIILERAEAYAAKKPVVKSMLDGFGMGFGFAFALTCLGTVREVLGAGTWLGFPVFGPHFEPWVLFVLPPGGFIALAIWLLTFSSWRSWRMKRTGGRQTPTPSRFGGCMNESLSHIFLDAFLINNFVLCVFLGMCSFIGLSGKFSTAWRMGLSVMFVITASGILSYYMNQLLIAVHAEYLRIITYIVIIAATVQLTEMFIKKTSPALFHELGVYLPLITTNCAVLFVPLMLTARNYNLAQSAVFSISGSGGYCAAICLLSLVRERIDLSDVTSLAKGTALTLVLAAILSMAFMGFAGMGGGA